MYKTKRIVEDPLSFSLDFLALEPFMIVYVAKKTPMSIGLGRNR